MYDSHLNSAPSSPKNMSIVQRAFPKPPSSLWRICSTLTLSPTDNIRRSLLVLPSMWHLIIHTEVTLADLPWHSNKTPSLSYIAFDTAFQRWHLQGPDSSCICHPMQDLLTYIGYTMTFGFGIRSVAKTEAFSTRVLLVQSLFYRI